MRAVSDPLIRVIFFWSKCSSALKDYTWTNFTQYIRAAVSSVAFKTPTEISLCYGRFAGNEKSTPS